VAFHAEFNPRWWRREQARVMLMFSVSLPLNTVSLVAAHRDVTPIRTDAARVVCAAAAAAA